MGGIVGRERAAGRDAGEVAHRRQHNRNAQLGSKERGGGIDLADVTEHTRAQRQAIVGLTVARQGRLGLRAAADIVPDILRQCLVACLDDLVIGMIDRAEVQPVRHRPKLPARARSRVLHSVS